MKLETSEALLDGGFSAATEGRGWRVWMRRWSVETPNTRYVCITESLLSVLTSINSDISIFFIFDPILIKIKLSGPPWGVNRGVKDRSVNSSHKKIIWLDQGPWPDFSTDGLEGWIRVKSAREGFMTYTTASHQGAIKAFGFTFGEQSCCPSLYTVKWKLHLQTFVLFSPIIQL